MFDERRFSVIVSKLSIVFALIDTFTAGPPIVRSYTVKLDGCSIRPMYKNGGYVVFQNIPTSSWLFRIESPYYMTKQIHIEPDFHSAPLEPITIPLVPAPTYPFARGTTLLRAKLADKFGVPRSAVTMLAQVKGPSCAKAKIVKEDLKQGAQSAFVSATFGRLFPGERLRLAHSDGSEELVEIAEVADEGKRCSFAAPLERSYPRGSQLYPVIEAISNRRGELVVPFSAHLPGSFDVLLHTVGTTEYSKEVKVSGGEWKNVGMLSW